MARDDIGNNVADGGTEREGAARGVGDILASARERGSAETAERITRLEGEDGHESLDLGPAGGGRSSISADSPLASLDGVSPTEPEADEVEDTRELFEVVDGISEAEAGTEGRGEAGDTAPEASVDDGRRVAERPQGANPDAGAYEYVTGVYFDDGGRGDGDTERVAHTVHNRAERNVAAQDVFDSASSAARFEERDQVRRLRNSIDRCDKGDFERFKRYRLGAANRQQKQERIRQAQINRRQTYRQLALGCLFQGETMFQGMMSAAGLTLGYLISGGFGRHVSNRTGLTRGESLARRLDRMVGFFEGLRKDDEAVMDGGGQRKRGFFLDRVLIPARDRVHWLIGKPIPDSVSTLATYQLAIMSRAMEDMSAPGADILAVRRDAFDDIKSLYEIAQSEGISQAHLDAEAKRIGRRLDASDDVRNCLSVNFGGVEETVSSVSLRSAFTDFLGGELDPEVLRHKLCSRVPDAVRHRGERASEVDADGRGANGRQGGAEAPSADGDGHAPDEPDADASEVASEGPEAGEGSEENAEQGTDAPESAPAVALRREVPDDELHVGGVLSAKAMPEFDDDVDVVDNVADVFRELRERGTFGDALVYPGGLEFGPTDLPAVARAYQFAYDDSIPETSLMGQERLGHNLRRASEVLTLSHASDGVSKFTLTLGLDRDLCAVANGMYSGGLDLTDPWGELQRAFAQIEGHLAETRDDNFHDYRHAAREVASLMVDLFEHRPGEPYAYGIIGDVKREEGREPGPIDELADKLRFAFECEPISRYAFANAMYRRIVRPQSDVFTKDLLDAYGEHGLSYFDMDDRIYSAGTKNVPLVLVNALGDSLDPMSLKLSEKDAADELSQEIDVLNRFSPIGISTLGNDAFAPLASFYRHFNGEFEDETISARLGASMVKVAQRAFDEAQQALAEAEKEKAAMERPRDPNLNETFLRHAGSEGDGPVVDEGIEAGVEGPPVGAGDVVPPESEEPVAGVVPAVSKGMSPAREPSREERDRSMIDEREDSTDEGPLDEPEP